MKWRSLYLRFFWLYTVLAHVSGYAQVQGRVHAISGVDASGNSETVEAALHQMSDQAPVIFVGTVIDVQRTEGDGIGGGIVEIQFEVEQAIRGCSGGTYTLREWGGLWTANDARYRVGQRLLLLLHAPGATGFSSPVGGMDGAIPLRSSGSGVKASDGSTTAAQEVADLRWIGAKLARTVNYRNPRMTGLPMARSLNSSSPAAGTDAGATSSNESSSTPAQEAAVSTVVGMIRSWGVSDATR